MIYHYYQHYQLVYFQEVLFLKLKSKNLEKNFNVYVINIIILLHKTLLKKFYNSIKYKEYLMELCQLVHVVVVKVQHGEYYLNLFKVLIKLKEIIILLIQKQLIKMNFMVDLIILLQNGLMVYLLQYYVKFLLINVVNQHVDIGLFLMVMLILNGLKILILFQMIINYLHYQMVNVYLYHLMYV